MKSRAACRRMGGMFTASTDHFLLKATVAMMLLAPLSSQAQEAVADKAPAEKSGHLFILSGQSNMTGGLEAGFTATIKKAFGDDPVTIVLQSKPGRGIRFWVKDYELPETHPFHGQLKSGNGEAYPELLKAVKDAGDARTFKTVTFIWMQGESDAERGLGVAYEKSFTTLFNQLKSDLGVDEIHFVIGRLSDFGLQGDKEKNWKEMRAVQMYIAATLPLGAWIDTDDLNGGDASNPHGALHYPAEQYPKLGERFARKALEQLRVKTK